ncbi:unnamed protein product [Boreogadus saida]
MGHFPVPTAAITVPTSEPHVTHSITTASPVGNASPTTTAAATAAPTTTTTTTTPTTTPTSAPVPSAAFCAGKPDGLYSNDKDVKSFYQCSHGMTYTHKCPASLVFKDSCKCCNWA